MKWTHLATLIVVFAVPAAASAANPKLIGTYAPRQAVQTSWWARLGQPVEAEAATEGETAVEHVYGDSALYGPAHGHCCAVGSCDYTPPCVGDLWAGYVQRPLRCNPHYLRRHHGCGGCCNRGGCKDGACSDAAGKCGCNHAVPTCGCTTAAPAGDAAPLNSSEDHAPPTPEVEDSDSNSAAVLRSPIYLRVSHPRR